MRRFIVEALRGAYSRRLSFIAQVVLFAGMTAALVFTSVRNEVERDRLRVEFERAGTVRVDITAVDDRANVNWELVQRLGRFSTTRAEVAFRSATDVRALPVNIAGTPVTFRSLAALGDASVVAPWLGRLRVDKPMAGSNASRLLGAEGGFARVQQSDGTVLSTFGEVSVPPPYESLNSEILLRESSAEATLGHYSSVSVIVRDATDVARIQSEAVALLVDRPSGSVTVNVPTELLDLEKQLAASGNAGARQSLIAALLGLGILVGIANTLVLNGRRRELGRRRALGASRLMIMGLIVAEAVVISVVGSVVSAVALAVAVTTMRAVSFDPLVLLDAAWLAVIAAAIGAVGPALRAVLVDPVEALRIP